MMKKVSFLMLFVLSAVMNISAQTNIRYVSKSGAYANDGKSWANAKLNIQDAINDLVNNHLTGEVWVAAGTYTPTESTESSGGSTLYMSFKIPEGITVRGGFAGTEATAADRARTNYTSIGWFYTNRTILSGNLSSDARFTWNAEKEQWNTTFYGNTYHVVWFATKGFDSETGRANPVSIENPKAALLEGCVVTGGNAHNNTVTGRTHNAYGGGVYMVPGTSVENCWIYNCTASRDGGGVYMDGGGYLEHVYVQDCQALGIGVQNGYGGGVCVDGPEKAAVGTTTKNALTTNPKAYVIRSGITGCVGRMGGGLAYNTHDLLLKYNLCGSAVLVSNNTATTEAGGVYVNKGAALDHMTIVRNKCNGTGVTIGGMQTGRAAGIYVRDNAHIANSLFWGGTVGSNNDIQYASSRSKSDDNLKPLVQFTMLSKADYVDWSGTQKNNVEKLSDFNNLQARKDSLGDDATAVKGEPFPMFNHPSDTAGYVVNVGLRTIRDYHDGAGQATTAFDWQVNPRSAATHRGVLTFDLDSLHETPAQERTSDILGGLYTARVTIGAYNSRAVAGRPYMYADDGAGNKYVFNFAEDKLRFEDEGGNAVDASSMKKIANLYVDPSEEDQEEAVTNSGSWDTPAKYLPDALYYIKTWWVDPSYSPIFSLLDEINVYVKEGTVYNTSAHYEGHVRNATIEIPHLKRYAGKVIQLNIIGGMDKTLTGYDVSRRDPIHHPTVITGNIMDDYQMNASHLVTFNGCHDVLFDGFQIRYANAKSTKLDNNDQNGAAMYFKENTEHTSADACNEPGGMAYKCCRVKVKNVLVAGCTAVNGAAVYAVDNSQVDFENCIFHNNRAGATITVRPDDTNGIVYAASGTTLTFDHCDVLRNVGFAFAGTGSITLTNSMAYANMKNDTEDTNDKESSALKPIAQGTTLLGSNNLFDTQAGDMGAVGINTLIFHFDSSTGGENYPRFINPTKNAGVSPKGDVTYYGRATSFEPTNTNPMVNAASADGAHTAWGTDMSTNTTRDFGGRPDIGAIENHIAGSAEGENANSHGQPAYGTLIYVRDYRNNDNSINYTAGGDGASWATAINGNAYYYSDGSHSANAQENIGGYWVETTYRPVYSERTPTGGITRNEGVVLKNKGNNRYLKYDGGTAFSTTANLDDASIFIIETSATNGAYYIKSGGNYIGSNGTNQFRAQQTNWYITGSANNYNIRVSSSGNGIRLGSITGGVSIGGVNATGYYGTWSILEKYQSGQTVDVEGHYAGGGNENGVKGVQYAVNLAHDRMAVGKTTRTTNQGEKYSGGTQNTTHTYYDFLINEDHPQIDVWVAAGTYTKTDGYLIRNHVKVYGGFPATGNPGLAERHPLLTSGVALSSENKALALAGSGADDAEKISNYIAKYETILQTNSSIAERDGNSAKIAHVLSQTYNNFECRTTTTDNDYNRPRSRVVYEGCEWDGFTMRYGRYTPDFGGRQGGAGVSLYENVVLSNCIIRDNAIYTGRVRGAGLYCDGSKVVNCYIMNNYASSNSDNNYGGGMYMIKGTMYNSVICGNALDTSQGSRQGAGCYFESANFYNNTVVNNTGASTIGVYTASGADAHLTVYNSIIMSQDGQSLLTRASNDTKIGFTNCFLQTNQSALSSSLNAVTLVKNKTHLGVSPDLVNPFALDYDTANEDRDYRITQNMVNTALNCVNEGTDDLGKDYDGESEVVLPSNDMDYTERIQDCTVDIGAYEFNGAYTISPDLTSVTGQAIYYVTPNGYGFASGDSPANAACASKLQKVLDAAGRYKFQAASGALGEDKKNIKVIVKVANSYNLLHPSTGDPEIFKYTATRTTDHSDQNARIWSIIVPHGVEVWGGYTDVALNDAGTAKLLQAEKPVWTNQRNGFYKKVAENLSTPIEYTELRDITVNQTFFDGEFTNMQEYSVAHSYHTITFCDRVYDVDGYPYLTADGNPSTGALNAHSTFDKLNPPTSEDGYLHMSDVALLGREETFNHHRAVIDGIFVSGGNANADEGSSELLSVGGAAVVTDFAHVRNCIILDNYAKKGGGLALANRGLVSGTLLMNNSAELGGGIYSIPNGVKLANSTINNTTTPPVGKTMDWNMPHVFTSTIVGNSATKQGGGIYYSNENPNVRVNSCVIWNNDAPDQANVAGIVSPDKPADDTNSTLAFYPFGYTAIQNLRASGTNNLKVETEGSKGVRFDDDDLYYGLTDYSILARTGMPVGDYDALVSVMDLTPNDFTFVGRKIDDMSPGTRIFIDMGARAIDKKIIRDQLMLRLFVAMPEDINMTIAKKMADLADTELLEKEAYKTANPDIDEDQIDESYEQYTREVMNKRYYSQEGSSFAYPMHSLQDALDYIYDVRSIVSDGHGGYRTKFENANNMPFEICMAGGIYVPTRDLSGNYGQSAANTFLIPEGVSIIGGFKVGDYNGGGSYFGRYNVPSTIGIPSNTLDSQTGKYTTPTYYTEDNVESLWGPGGGTQRFHENTTIIEELPLEVMMDRRRTADVNANTIVEPWEFLYETVLDGNAVNAEGTGVYHVLTAVPDQTIVGALPTRSIERKAGHYEADGKTPVGNYQWLDREEGQTIYLNGLTVTGGRAFDFVEGALDEMSNYSYYHGGAFLIDGNRYNDNYNKMGTIAGGTPDPGLIWQEDKSHDNIANLNNTKASYMHTGVSNAVGYRDIPVSISQCKFVNNKAGYGGAISTNTTVDIFMSSFESNLAEAHSESVKHNGITYTVAYPGQGGAVYATHQFSAFNTIFANNEARDANYDAHGITLTTFPTLRNQHPTQGLLGGAGGAAYCGLNSKFHLVNCNFVRNMANMYPAVFTMSPNTAAEITSTITTPEYNQMVNTVVWGNEVNKNMITKYGGSNEWFKFASGLICNFGKSTRGTNAYDPSFTDGNAPKNQEELDNSSKFEETAWFSAYEPGRGITQDNSNDLRDADYRPFMHAKIQLANEAYRTGHVTPEEHALNPLAGYQNCNISIDAENDDLEGPNFINPSLEAGIVGYVESADWSPARLNKMTDNGSGKIMQTISIDKSQDYKYKSDFPSYAQYNEAHPDNQITLDKSDADFEHGNPGGRFYSIETEDNVITSGAYTMTRFLNDYRHYNRNLPLGKEYYMQSANSAEQQLLRISFDPNPTHNQTYIDIGVYEYPHTELMWHTEDECDILWVSSGEKPENGLPDGSDWSQPTSDLQRAIETLLASRNGHRKEIRLLDGTYTPVYTINGHLSFYIDTEYQNASVMLPLIDDTSNPGQKIQQEGYGIKSLTIKGGYSDELENMYDLSQYPAIFRGQNRTNANEDTWDHLFFIQDASQRYGNKQGYAEENYYGWEGVGGTPSQDNTMGALIPIEFDGVTFVNNQARTGQKGAAIYYADQNFTNKGQRSETGPQRARSPLGANVRIIKQYYYDQECTRPADEPTMFYKLNYDVSPSDPAYDASRLTENYLTLINPAKFVMSKCKVMNSGKLNDATTSAVYIGKEGGESIFFNNVFHSNWGDPLEAYGAKLINNTFALNRGYTVLHDYVGENNGYDDGTYTNNNINPITQYTCSAFNNVFWRNGIDKKESLSGKAYEFKFFNADGSLKFDGYGTDSNSDGVPDELASCGSYFKRNAYFGGPTTYTDYSNDKQIATLQNFNVGLVADNDNVIDGPNFTNPLDENRSYTESEIESRDFTLQPSLRLINKGDMELYKNGVSYNTAVDNAVDTDGIDQDITIYDFAWMPTTAHDAASKRRKIPNTNLGQIDLGAYEYQNQLERVIYVNPNSGISGLGNTWADPIGEGNLQAAIDLAAVYCVNSANEQAYVFVKGSNVGEEKHTGERITLRDGVQIFGGIDPGYNVDARAQVSDAYTQEGINDYIATIKNTRRGVADPNGFKTRITGVRTSSSTKFNQNDKTSTFIDGFVITPVSDVTPTEPAIDIDPGNLLTVGGEVHDPKIAVRNVIVSDFDLTESRTKNVANVNNALLYEALFRDNKVYSGMSVLNMKAKGYGVNLTVEGNTTGATANIYNSLINYGDDVKKTFSGYSYPLADKNLNYQLAEGSKQIDQCAATVPAGLPTGLQGFIDYAHDRDLLGNPRKLDLNETASGTPLDLGAFETWRVNKNTEANTTPGNYGGNYYPHDGSVVYIENNKSFVSAHEFVPGYLLVKKGASLYGNGFDVKAAYVAVERDVKEAGDVISLPFAMDYKSFDNDAKAGVATTSIDENGVLTQDPFAGKNVYYYDGSERSAADYDFANAGSPCWKDATGVRSACEGILYIPNSAQSNVRFTAKGSSMTDYIYTESGVSKSVTLTQYNHGNANTGNSADFTANEDMGWNAIGLPYLVSEYKPYEEVNAVTAANEASTGIYRMHIPHTLWLYYDGQNDPNGNTVNGDGGFYSVNSWESTYDAWHVANTDADSDGDIDEARIWVGEGFFTQTATLAGTEDLVFYRPVAPASFSPAKPLTRYYVTDGIQNIDLDSNGDAYIIDTQYFGTDGIQLEKPRRGVTIVRDIYSDGTTRSRKIHRK